MRNIGVNASPENLEKEGLLEEAAEGYEKIISEHPLNLRANDRLMIVYRKLKEYKKELQTVERAIDRFEEHYKKHQPIHNKKIATLSKALLKATGLADNKGNNIYEPGELMRWKKRRDLLLKKLKAASIKRKKGLKKD